MDISSFLSLILLGVLLIGCLPSTACPPISHQSLSDLMQLVKGDSSEWINKEKLVPGKFRWQEGYGAFSYSRSHGDAVVKYILNQEAHHRKKTFLEEYKEMLNKFEVEYDEKYIFKELE